MLGGRADPEDDRAALAHEREAPLGRNRRFGERLRDRDAVRLDRLLLGTPPHDSQVRELVGPALEKLALPALCLEQRHRPLGKRRRERDPGRPAARPDVGDGAVLTPDDVHAEKRVVEQHPAGGLGLTERREAGRRHDGRKPAVEDGALMRIGLGERPRPGTGARPTARPGAQSTDRCGRTTT